ncbi:MAG: hypothetical protein IH594_19630 [Bacteroidales bacterium]|nr:hypothetical protein [Bacteroidales bacterium]
MGGHQATWHLSSMLKAAQFLSALLMMTCHSDRANVAIAKGAREEPPDRMGKLPFYFIGYCHFPLYDPVPQGWDFGKAMDLYSNKPGCAIEKI